MHYGTVRYRTVHCTLLYTARYGKVRYRTVNGHDYMLYALYYVKLGKLLPLWHNCRPRGVRVVMRAPGKAGARHAGRSLGATMSRHAAAISGPKVRPTSGGSCPPPPLQRGVSAPWPGLMSPMLAKEHVRELLSVRRLPRQRGRGCGDHRVSRRHRK